MCYDISFTVDIKQLSDYFPEVIPDHQLQLDFDGTHIIGHLHSEHPILYRNRDDGRLHVRMMEWGCIPFYIKELEAFKKQRATMLNARSEKILADKKSYWNKIRNRRCLVPVNGFYEHRSVPGFKTKIPYFLTLKKQPLFFLPGLYSAVEVLDKRTGELVKTWTYTIITRPANRLMKEIHNEGDNRWRMPLMLNFEKSIAWLSEELPDDLYQDLLEFEMPPEEMNSIPVYSIRTSKMRPDFKVKNEKFPWENLPEIILY